MFCIIHSSGLGAMESQHARCGGALKIRDPDDINDGDEETEAERHDQDDLLLSWKAHPREDRHGQEEDREIRDDVDGRGGQIQRDDVCTRGARRLRVGESGPRWTTLEGVDQRQPQSCRIHHEESRIVCPAEDPFPAGQGQVEDEDRRFDRHQRGVLDEFSMLTTTTCLRGETHIEHGEGILGLLETGLQPWLDVGLVEPQAFRSRVEEGEREAKVDQLESPRWSARST